MQRFLGSISTICFSAGDEAQRCRANWTKTGPQHMGPYRYLLPQAYFPTKLHSTGLYARIHKEGFEMDGKMNSADVCNRAPIITAWGLGPAQERQKLTGLKVCLVHSEPLLELNSDLH